MKISSPTPSTIVNTKGSHFNLQEPVLPILESWAPAYLTDPSHYKQMKQQVSAGFPFKFIVHTAPMDHLINRQGVFSENAEYQVEGWDAMSVSLISNEKSFCYRPMGVILLECQRKTYWQHIIVT